MSDRSEAMHCSVPGCPRSVDHSEKLPESICDHHLSMAKPHLRARLDSTARRLSFVQSYWNDEAAFDALVAQDRHMQLTNATCCAQEAFDVAWARFKLSILSAEAIGPQGMSAPGHRAVG